MSTDDTPTEDFEAFSAALDRMANAHATETGIPQRGGRHASGGPRYAFDGSRDMWESLGYPSDRQLTYSDYRSWYERGDVAKPIVEKPPATTWKEAPVITDRDVDDPAEFEPQTQFEKDVAGLFDAGSDTGLSRGLRHYLRRADLLGRIGEYSVLFLGFADVDSAAGLEQPVGGGMSGLDDLLFLTPLGQGDVDIEEWDTDVTSERNGLPEIYELDLSNGGDSEDHLVHHSRVIHIAEGVVDNEVKGEPALRSVINRLIDIQKIAGASGEAYWRVSNPGLALNTDPELQDVDTDKMKKQVEEWEHKLRRVLKLYGTEVEQLDAQDVDPEAALDSELKLVAGAVGIPQRKLVGSERGELASSMDEATYIGTISERQTDFAEPVVLRPFVDRNVRHGVISQPQDNTYAVLWPDLFELTDLEKAKIKEAEGKSVGSVAPMGDPSALHSIEALQDWSPIEEPEGAPEVDGEPDEDIDEDDEEVIEQFESLRREGSGRYVEAND